MTPINQFINKSIRGKVLTCYCDGICPESEMKATCKTRPGGSCFSSVAEISDNENSHELEPERIYGCMATSDDGGLFSVIYFILS